MTETWTHASLASQLRDVPCAVEDTEEIFWLRESDDYQSRFRLGSAFAVQYRFREAVSAFQSALHIRQDDWKLWYSLAGAELTLRRFQEAEDSYRRCLSLGAEEKTVAFPLGIAAYLQKDYRTAAQWFEACLPCGDEMMIAVLYWHSLACCRAGVEPFLLKHYRRDMQVGHHTAYQLAVSVFCGETDWTQAALRLENEPNDLDHSIAMYGLCVYLETAGRLDDSRQFMERLLRRDGAWPCVSYLAAWNDCYGEGSDMTKEAVIEFFDSLAPYWDKDLVVDREKINFILDKAGVGSGSRVLDVACGTGVLFPFCVQRGVAQVTAVDISPEMAKIAAGKTDDPRLQVICGDIEALEPTGSFDCCVVYNAFPHFPEPERLIGALAKWLRPGGRLTVAHGMSLAALNAHHSGRAAKVSRGMLPAPELAELFAAHFQVDTALSDEEKYVVSGTLPPSGGGG